MNDEHVRGSESETDSGETEPEMTEPEMTERAV